LDQLDGRVALVTGAANGIGRGTALAFARQGVNVVLADIDAEAGAAVAAEIAAMGGQAIFFRFDVARDLFETLRDTALTRFGRIDIVMNNVGILTRGVPEAIPVEEWQRVIDINLLSVVRSNLVFVPHLVAQREGHIVNTASFAGLYTYAFDRLPYAACKAAIVQISEGLAIYLKPFGVNVTLLCPGPVRTEIAKSVRAFGPATDVRGPGPQFGLMEPYAVGEQVIAAILANRFWLPTHEAVRDELVARASDWDGYIQRQIDDPHIALKIAGADTGKS
jgi:NAD(P)-dependent dehydrogenase (short-subunit alcohol dehydrogenase family)